jgi:glutamate dehydrogenase/leucine dehydrogenase
LNLEGRHLRDFPGAEHIINEELLEFDVDILIAAAMAASSLRIALIGSRPG